MSGVVLIGGAGFVGSHLARRLLDRGVPVLVLDDPALPGGAGADERLRGAERLDVALTDGGAGLSGLAHAIAERAPHAIVHLANLPLADVAGADPAAARAGILDITRAALVLAGQVGSAPRFTYVSSSMVYGDFSADPMPEDGPCRPSGTYGQLKLEAEALVRAQGARSGLPTTIVRPSAVYGPGERHHRFVSRVIDAARHGTPLTLRGAGRSRLDFTWVGDLVTGIDLATHAPAGAGATFNLTRGEARSLLDVVSAVNALGWEVDVRLDPEPDALRPERGALDIGRARRLLGYAPAVRLEDGVRALLDPAPAPVLA